MKKFIFTTGLLFLFNILINAQNEEDALRYSRTTVVGTARFAGMCGAFGALGADFSTLSANPAGIGLFTKSEFSISPNIYTGKTISSYMGNSLDDSRTNFALGNAGVVIVIKPVDRLDKNLLKNIQVGFGINRLKDFNNRIMIEGFNDKNSILDTYVEYSDGINPKYLNDFDTRLAFDTYLIDTIPGETNFQYLNAYEYIGGFHGSLQRKSIETKGSINEPLLSGGGNFNNKLYFGISLGFPYIRYKQNSTYSEKNQNEEKDIDEFYVNEWLETKGSGINIKVGAIFRATDWLRIGAAYHSPTWYNNMRDRWNSRMQAYYTNGDYFNERSPNGEFDYRIQTPMKAIGSIAVIFGKLGLLSFDYEYIDYSSAKLKSSQYSFFDENNTIKNNFDAANNIRIGTEWRFDLLSVRGGYANYGSPFKSGVNDGKMQAFSGGLGYREKFFFIDFAFIYSIRTEDYYLYNSPSYQTEPVSNDYKSYNYLLTFGYRFQ